MDIRINTDNHISNSVDFSAELSDSFSEKLGKFSSHITTVEIYLCDENASKSGPDDKKCSIEVRLEGLSPLAASHNADTLRNAFNGASKKIERVVKGAIERQKSF